MAEELVKEGIAWDVMLLCLLFAYREVPLASTSSSLFELLRSLDVLSVTWQISVKSEESVVSHDISS